MKSLASELGLTVKLLIVSEYAAKGCLFDYLTNNQLNFGQILRWSTDIAVGKYRLHVMYDYSVSQVKSSQLYVGRELSATGWYQKGPCVNYMTTW